MVPIGSKMGTVNRKIIRKSVKKFIRDFEKKSGILMPELTKKFIFDTVKMELLGVEVNKIPQFLSHKIEELDQLMKNLEETSEKVDENCRLMVDKLAKELCKNEKEPFLDFLATYARY